MKTLLYNPIFINPLAYYVFPRLTRYLQPDNESTAEPANYIGTIEVRVIAYGDTNLVRTYTNTNEIDLSEFKNTYIRISLFTKVGSCVLGEWKVGGIKEDLPYIDPEVLESLRAVVVVDNKNNYDKDRATITNLVDPDNPFIASNFAWKANSGYGKYEIDFDTWIKSNKITSTNSESFNFTTDTTWVLLYYKSDIGKDMPSFKVHIKLEGEGKVYYNYVNSEGVFVNDIITQEEYVTPISYNTKYTGETPVNCGFTIGVISNKCSGTITQIPSFQGALVTDGVDDLITSTKTAQEMLGGSTEITVVSMINTITPYRLQISYTNAFPINRTNTAPLRNEVSNTGKTGIYGYTYKNNVVSVINNVLGDKNDYTAAITGEPQVDDRFEVTRTKFNSSVAWYWTFIAKKALTTDQINQVIAYYNLDKYVKPDIYYDVKKQGLTNDTPDSDWYLKDFSGNGRDMQLYNYSKTPESGINEEGGLQSDGVTDYGQFVGDLGLKDYTVAVDRAYPSLKGNGVPVISGINNDTATPFLFEFADNTGIVRPYSFGATNVLSTILQSSRKISYQSTYIYNGNTINKGTKTNTGNALTIGRYGIDTQYANIALWSFLLFPYSLSEFLLERQLKKHKLGTLYPNMVEFRPIIKANNDYEIVYTAIIKPVNWQEISVGDYVTVGESVAIQIKLNNPLEVTNVSSNSLADISFYKEENSDNIYTIYGRVLDGKSPQKITIDIQVDSSLVQWNPVVESTAEYSGIGYLNYSHNLATINVGDYISIGDIVAIRVILDNTVDEIVNCKVNGQECEIVNVSPRVFDCKFTLTSESPQNINITIDEYIRYEDIVQPYPVLLRFNDENGNEVSWGGKFKVGSTITRIGSIADPESNLLNGLYSISGLSLNGKAVTSSTSIVEKQMVFKTIATYLLDNNEPKCILSPSRLRIPNSSYKLLGYIPDISGHGNHGKINNSAYAEGSGVNEDGSYQFDGVDDFVTIPTLSSGGKQVLMKVNLPRLNEIIYDQRKETNTYTFAILSAPSQIAYDQRNSERITYIDGILNTNIIAEQLMGVTHNIVVINSKANLDNTRSPILGRDINGNNWSRMRIYDFMLFDEISTDDKILELNEYVGIEGNTE